MNKEDFEYQIMRMQWGLLVFKKYIETLEGFFVSQRQEDYQKYKSYNRETFGTEFWEQVLTETGVTEIEAFEFSYSAKPENSYPNILRKSAFTNLFSYIEVLLIEVCNLFRLTDSKLGVSDMRGQNEIDRARTYLSEVLQISFPSTSQEWQEIQKYRNLRNCIIHNDGKLNERLNSKKKSILTDYIKHKANVLALVNDEIIIRNGFCIEVLETTEKFFNLLFIALSKMVEADDNNISSVNTPIDDARTRRGKRVAVIHFPYPTKNK